MDLVAKHASEWFALVLLVVKCASEWFASVLTFCHF